MLEIGAHAIVVRGRWLRVAAVFDEDWHEEGVRDPAVYVARLRAYWPASGRPDLFTFAQRLPDTHPRFPYPSERDSVAVIRIRSVDDWYRNRLSADARRNVKIAMRHGLVVRAAPLDDALVRGIAAINDESPIRQGKRFAHYRAGLDAVERALATYPERSHFIGAYYEDELIGFVRIVRVGLSGQIMQLLTKASHREKKPANALIAEAVRYCVAERLPYLTFGRFQYGNRRTSSLRSFKRRTGFEEMLVPRYNIPLTVKGRIAVELGLHRRLIERLPDPIASALWNLRRVWVQSAVSEEPSGRVR
jgi:hypothetical protein